MKSTTIYDTDVERINDICDKNDITEAELIEALLDNCDEILEFYGWKK